MKRLFEWEMIKFGQESNSKKAPCFRMRLFRLFDAWQLYDGLPARHPSGSTSCCANPFPTDLSY
ncbi:hypothetical protein ACX3SV_14935, partial [Hafnia paralvei]